MKTIAMYDITGIQEFVFASNKVKENVGASLIVQKVFEEYLNKAIKESCTKYLTDWNDYSDFQICSDPEIQTEVIYTGGGNAMLIYQNRETAINVTKRLSFELSEKTGGTLKFAAAYLDTECENFLKDREKLTIQLKINKYEMIHTSPLLGIGITREGNTDGLPAMFETEEDNTKKYISESADFKRKALENESGYFDDLLPNATDYEFPLEFDDLGQKVGENYIAVVHIDGNNMGKMLDDFGTSDYQRSVKTMRDFSKQVDEKYHLAMKLVVQKLADALKDEKFRKKIKPVFSRKLLLPIRPIVRSGDDVTFVCNGKIGIILAKEFLTDLHKNSEIHINGKKIQLSACAGVAIVKSHFPFYRAYQLAEELCNSAKMKGKTLAKINGVEEIGNWLDFHIVQTGITNSLNEIRDKFYQVPGMKQVKELTYPDDTEHPEMRYQQYNLLWRPWCVTGDVNGDCQWKELEKIYEKFTKDEKDDDGNIIWKSWNRSRLKKLESEMTKSSNDAQAYIRECKSRDFKLPECFGSSDLYRDEQTPYFDVLELLDFYEQLPKAEDASHEN